MSGTAGMMAHLMRAPSETSIPYEQVLRLLTHSVVIGTVLVLVTYLTTGTLLTGKKKELDRPKEFLGTVNLLFLCVGLTGVMLLVNNNIIRAFAIVAAIALMRFRVKLTKNNLNASLLFAVIGGMACGLNELTLAWTMTGVYLLLLIFVVGIFQIIKIRN